MISLLTDEDFNGAIYRGLRRRHPDLDIVRVQDVGLMETHDSEILEWAAQHGRVFITHDINTVTLYAYDRVRRGERMPGVVVVNLQNLSIGQAIDEILILALCDEAEQFIDQVRYIPL